MGHVSGIAWYYGSLEKKDTENALMVHRYMLWSRSGACCIDFGCNVFGNDIFLCTSKTPSEHASTSHIPFVRSINLLSPHVDRNFALRRVRDDFLKFL